MEHMDEKIIAMLYPKAKTGGDETGKEKPAWQYDLQQAELNLDGEKVVFARHYLLDGKVEIVMPTSFFLMSEEEAKLKYLSERRPPIIYTNESTSLNLTFNPTPYELDPDEMELFKDTMLSVLKRSQPAARWIEDGLMEVDGKTVGFCTYLTPALDCNLFLFQLFVELEGRVLIVTFNCTEEEMDDWQPLAYMMMESLKWKSEAEGEDQE